MPSPKKQNKPAQGSAQPLEADTAPKEVIYKSHTFGVRDNYLGVGRDIDELMQQLDDSELTDMVWLFRLPEYQVYMQIRNDMRSISIDVNEHKAALKTCKDKARIKELNSIIAAGTKALSDETKKLYDPVISAIMLRESRLNDSINFKFTNDIDNLKAAAGALLTGDLSVINYDEPDADLVKFRDTVFKIFFYTRNRIQSAPILQ